LIGSPDPDAIDDSVVEIERELGRQVNVTILSPSEWEHAEGFRHTVQERPVVRLALADA
jgi:hypothetical protein